MRRGPFVHDKVLGITVGICGMDDTIFWLRESYGNGNGNGNRRELMLSHITQHNGRHNFPFLAGSRELY